MPNEQANKNDAKEKGRKRTREGGSQTDEEDVAGIGTSGSHVDNAALQRTQDLVALKKSWTYS